MLLKMFLLALTLANLYTSANCLPNLNTLVKLNSLQCFSEGRNIDPNDCGQYFDCIPNDNGVLVALQKSCFGHAFDPTLKACVPKQMVQGCIPYSTRSLKVSDPKFQHLCSNKTNKFVCSDCKTLIICVDGVPYTDPCRYGTVCSRKSNFGDAVCYPSDPEECTCNKADIIRQDHYDPSKFLSCGPEGRDSDLHACPDGLVFNEARGTCCTENGSSCSVSVSHAKDECTRYSTSILTNKGWFQKEYTCKNKTMFNDDTGKCEDPCTWYSGYSICKAEGRFVNPSDCTKYYECISNPLNSDSFIYIEQDCPVGHEWNQSVNSGFGHCVIKGTGEEKCVPLKPKPYKCQIPNECSDPTTATTITDVTTGKTTDKPTDPTTATTITDVTTGKTTDKPTVTCDAPGAQMIGGQCLYFSTWGDGTKTWDDAVTACADMGGELAQSLLDPQAVVDYVKANSGLYGFVGATDVAEEGTWRWRDETLMDSNFPWRSGYPSGGSSNNCLAVDSGGYHDYNCASLYRYLCDLGGAPSQVIRTEVKTPGADNMLSNTKCVSPWIYAGDSTGCLLHIQLSMDWHSAQAYCNSMDGDLPMLDRESKHIDMMDYFQRSGLENVSFWLGANDNSGSLLWVNGMPVRDGWKYTQSKVDQGEDMCLYTYLLDQNGDPPLINYCSHLLHNIICQKRVM